MTWAFRFRASSKPSSSSLTASVMITFFIQGRREEARSALADQISLTNSVAADLVGGGGKKYYTTSGFVVLPHIQRCEDQQWTEEAEVLRFLSCTIYPVAEFDSLNIVAPWLSGTNTLWSCQEICQTPVSTCRGGTALCRNAAKNEGRKAFLSGVLTWCQE